MTGRLQTCVGWCGLIQDSGLVVLTVPRRTCMRIVTSSWPGAAGLQMKAE